MKYVAYYDLPAYKNENRSAFPSAVAVIEYMTEVFASVDCVSVLSPARTLNKKGIYRSRRHMIRSNVSLELPFSIGVKSKIGRLTMVAYTRLWLFFRLLFTVKKNEVVVAYHSMATTKALKLIKKLKHIRLIEEVREVYSDVNEMSAKMKALEYDFFAEADGFIFATELINNKINLKGKPYIIAPATYKAEKQLTPKYNDGDIHVIYAGTLRLSKGGAINAVMAAKYLPSNYHLHIVGYGDENEIKKLTEVIQCVRADNKGVKISYDGLLLGRDFKEYLQKCHIGLSTQTPEGAYNDSSFPSKVMTYLANGLEVVSIRIPAVETSPVGKYIHYYDEQDSKCLADAIQRVDVTKRVDKVRLLNELNDELVRNMQKLLQ